LSNAVKFTPSGGRIDVSCTAYGSARIAIRVRDTGRGIPPQHLDSIFEPFVQVGRSLIDTREGTGLGLAISRDLARGMRGDITVTSTVDVGSEFTLVLPTRPEV
jgi:signal transduction histidine kinase